MGVNKQFVIANWKMNMTNSEIERFIGQLKTMPQEMVGKLEIILCPPFVYLSSTASLLKDTFIKLGAQNIFWEEKGAYTGEISAQMIKESGCQYLILGHSERRKYFCETDEIINKKIKISLKNNLIPIVCIGENLEQKNEGATKKVIEEQLLKITRDLSGYEIKKIIIAYEPVWAISTSEENVEGKADNPEETQVIHKYIKKLMGDHYSHEIIKYVNVIYGGSVKQENVAEFARMPDINGLLIGSASLSHFKFIKIIEEFIKNKF